MERPALFCDKHTQYTTDAAHHTRYCADVVKMCRGCTDNEEAAPSGTTPRNDPQERPPGPRLCVSCCRSRCCLAAMSHMLGGDGASHQVTHPVLKTQSHTHTGLFGLGLTTQLLVATLESICNGRPSSTHSASKRKRAHPNPTAAAISCFLFLFFRKSSLSLACSANSAACCSGCRSRSAIFSLYRN